MERQDFDKQFLQFREQLATYLLRLSGNQSDAEDLLQNTYLKANKYLSNFLEYSSFKTWVFTIATNLARDHYRTKKRWSVNCQDNARSDAFAHPERIDRMRDISENTPSGKFEIMEHIDFCFTCMGKTLTIEQQICLILKDIYDFTMTEIQDISGLTEGKVKHAIVDARKILISIFEDRCTIVSKKGVCHQCSELNQILNPKQLAQEQLNKLKMYREAQKGNSKENLYALRNELVKSINPLSAAGTDLHSYFLSLMPQYSDKSYQED